MFAALHVCHVCHETCLLGPATNTKYSDRGLIYLRRCHVITQAGNPLTIGTLRALRPDAWSKMNRNRILSSLAKGLSKLSIE